MLAATYTAQRADQVSPARSIARRFPLAEGRERLLLAVAEGIGDPPSAEAEAAEALGRLEATASRTPAGTTAESVLRGGYAAAEEAIARLMRLPGSVPGSGAAMVAAVVDDNVATIANLGRGAAFLLREGELRRLSADHRWGAAAEPQAGAATEADATRPLSSRRPLGAGGASAPDVAPDLLLAPGDALLLCSEAIVRRLGSRVIAAAFEEFPVDDVSRELTDLAVQQAGAEGAAVALFQQPGGAPTALPVPPAPLVMAPVAAVPSSWRGRLPWLVLALAIVAGVAAVAGIFAVTRSGGGKATATRVAVAPATIVAGATPVRTPAAGAALASPRPPGASPAASAAAGVAASPARSATAAVSPIPLVAASLPACSGTGAPASPCRYTTQPGDSLSAIGDRFDLSAACFQAANRTHQPVPPQAPDFRIGAAEDYVIPNAATCAALVATTATPIAATSPAATGTAAATATAASATSTPAAVCTPRPGASAPNPLC